MLLIVSKLVFFYFRKIAACYVYICTWEMTFLWLRMVFLWALKIGQKGFLSSPIILEFSLSKLLTSYQELFLYQSIRWEWQMKYLGGVFGEFHLLGYFLSPLLNKHPNKWMQMFSYIEPHTFKVNWWIKRNAVLCFPLALLVEVSSPSRPMCTCQELVISSLLSTSWKDSLIL